MEPSGCLKKMWTFFENSITPSFMEKTFSKCSVVVASLYPFAPMLFFYQVVLLRGSDIIMLLSYT